MNMEDFLYKDETYRILGACFEVYKENGCHSAYSAGNRK